MRRIASYVFDWVLLGAPWFAYLGLALVPERGNWISGLAVAATMTMLAGAGTVIMLVLQAVLFLKRGRTLGMAATGLVATKGRRWLALFVGPLLLIVVELVQFQTISQLRATDVLSETAASVLQTISFVATPALNLVFLVGSQRRTLSDFLCGQLVVRDPGQSAPPQSFRTGRNIVDWIVAAVIGAPIATILGSPPIFGLALGGVLGLLAFGAFELILRKRTGATLGERVLAKSP